MRVDKKFEPLSVRQIVQHLNEIRMGTIVSVAQNAFVGTPLSWVARELDDDCIELVGHFAASNPQLNNIADHPCVFATFLGPNSYVSPRGLPTQNSAPTWNYTAVHIEGEATLLDLKATENAVETLISAVERGRPKPWTSLEMGARREQLMRHVVGVRIVSSRVDAKYKLGQNESSADLLVILRQIAEAGDTRLVSMMRAVNESRLA